MSDWASGYQSEVDYLYGYYPELNPVRMKLALAAAGFAAPETRTACELGFGQGVAVNLHAAASTTEWYGTDVSAAQASFAQRLAAASGAPVQLFDEAFTEFVERPDLPQFDYVALHGVWNYISSESRHAIVDFLRRKLRPGGVVYIGYNTLPGWAAFEPIQHLMASYSELQDSPGTPVVSRVDNALKFVDRLLAVNPAYLRAHPTAASRFAQDMQKDRQYLAHEHFNRHRSAVHFSTMAESLSPAKLSYVCSAYYLDNFDALHMVEAQRTLLEGVADPVMRQTVRDFLVNRDFRRDLWIKGPRRLSLLDQAEALRAERVVLVQDRADFELRTKGTLGEVTLADAVYNPVLEALSDHQPRTLDQLERTVSGAGLLFPQILQVVMMLTGMGKVTVAQDDAACERARAQSDRLNDFILRSARGNTEIRYMASPVIGGGVRVQRFDQLFLLGLSQGTKEVPALAEFVWQILAAQGQKIIREGKPIEAASESLNELNAQARHFLERVLPVLEALAIAKKPT